MKIDTLILSGGGPAGIGYHGILKALFDKDILNKDLDDIKEIITLSIGILASFVLLLKIDLDVSEKIATEIDFMNFLNLDDISVNNILDDYGIFDTDYINKLFKSLIKNYLKLHDLSLKELYDLSKIKLTVKVLNVTKKQYEYISYDNYPDLSIITLAEMTTSIPIFFKPVKYNNCLYVDPGLKNSFPILKCKSKNYLGILLGGGCGDFSKNKIFNEYPILLFLYNIIISNDINDNFSQVINFNDNKRMIISNLNIGINFDIDKEKKLKIIKECYDNTINHLTKYKLLD